MRIISGGCDSPRRGGRAVLPNHTETLSERAQACLAKSKSLDKISRWVPDLRLRTAFCGVLDAHSGRLRGRVDRPEPLAWEGCGEEGRCRRWAKVPAPLTDPPPVTCVAPVTISLPRRDPVDDVTIEAVAARAWTAHAQQPLGPWLLRANEGFTRSANSVAVLGDASGEYSALIEQAETFYARHDLPASFRLSFADRHRALVDELQDRGYAHDAEGDTTVMLCPLRMLRSAAPAERDGRVLISDTPSQEWIELWWASQEFDEHLREPATELLWDLRGRCGFAAHVTGGRKVATGLGVIEGPWVGVFCLGTQPDRRAQGSARRIVGALATWGIAHAAQTAYAEVPDENLPARRLFDRLRFAPGYRYRYVQRQAG